MLWNGVLATTIATLLATAAPAAADTFTVTSPEDVSGTCAQPPACASIRQAINSAHQTNGPDTVNIPAGEYHLALGALLIANDASGISLVGASARTTILYGTSSSRVIEIDTASATIAHLTARLGTATAGDSPYAFSAGTSAHTRATC